MSIEVDNLDELSGLQEKYVALVGRELILNHSDEWYLPY